MQHGDGTSDGTILGLSRRSVIAGALVGGVAAPLLAWRGLASGGGQTLASAATGNAGVNVLNFFTARELADVQSRRGSIDVTKACQRALQAGRQVFFPNGTYLVDASPQACLRARSDQAITFADGAVLKARANALDQYYVLLIEDVRNVTIQGGTILGERSAHRGTTGEHGFGIGVFGSTDVTLRGVTVRDCWGDGIYIGGRGLDGRSNNVRVEQCICDGNRRQGLTIAAVNGCAVIGGRFIRTRGALPASGIDIEPNYGVIRGIKRAKQGAVNIVVEGADCSDNEGHGLTVSQVHTRDVRITGLTAHRNGMSGISCGYPGSDVRFERPDCRDNGADGITVFGAPTWTSRRIHISDATCAGNRRSGISVETNVDGFSIVGGSVSGNGENGIVCGTVAGRACDNGVIENVRITGNSQRAHLGYDNVLLGPASNRMVVQGNSIKQGAGVRKPRFGLNIQSNGVVSVIGNDLRAAGGRAAASGLSKTRVVSRENLGLT